MKKFIRTSLLTAAFLSAALTLSSCISMRNTSDTADLHSEAALLKDALLNGLTAAPGTYIPEDAVQQTYPTELPHPMAQAEAVTGLTPVPEPPDKYADVNISFLAVGDNLIHPNLYTDAYYRGTAEKRYDFLPLYSNVASLIAEADLAFINQETPMAGADYGYSGWPSFNSPQQLGVDLCEIGFDIVSIANNHMLDKGASGYKSTLDFWNTQPVTLIGGYYNQTDMETIPTLKQDGVILALLSYTYGTNGISLPAGSELVVPYIDDELILSDLAKAEEIADFTIVSIHWGVENTQTQNAEQERLAQLLADNGADVILGSHSHTLQPLTYLTAADGRQVLCIYSLGNFVSGMSSPVNMVGGMLTFDIKGNGDGGLITDNVRFIPTVNYYGGDWYNTKIYLLDEYTDDIAATHGVQYQGGYLSPAKAREYVTNVIPAEFLAE